MKTATLTCVSIIAAYLPDKIDATDYVRRGKEIDETISSSMLGCQIPADDCPEDLIDWSNERKEWNLLLTQTFATQHIN